MATIGNNMSGKVSHIRDSYFDSGEYEYLQKLLADPKERAIHEKLLRKNADELYKKAMALIKNVELGKYNEEEMVKIEYMITHLLGAIEDLEKVIMLELDYEDKEKSDNYQYNYNYIEDKKNDEGLIR